jgi:hypothetical protein
MILFWKGVVAMVEGRCCQQQADQFFQTHSERQPGGTDNYGWSTADYFSSYCQEPIDWLIEVRAEILSNGSPQKRSGIELAIAFLKS